MPDGGRPDRRLLERLGVELVRAEERTSVLASLSGADLLSLVALLLAWTSILAFLRGEPNWAVLLMFGSFGFDRLDGAYARLSGTASPFGRRLDAFVDGFTYLATGGLLFDRIAPTAAVSAAVGFALVGFGGLRLVRHGVEGFGTDARGRYYHGTTVVHTNLVVVANYLLALLVDWSGWLAAATVVAAAPLMISDYKAYRTRRVEAVAGAAVLLASAVVVAAELGRV